MTGKVLTLAKTSCHIYLFVSTLKFLYAGVCVYAVYAKIKVYIDFHGFGSRLTQDYHKLQV